MKQIFKHRVLLTVISLIFILLFISGCAPVDIESSLEEIDNETIDRYVNRVIICEEPYMRFSYGCCIDRNSNKVCDNNE